MSNFKRSEGRALDKLEENIFFSKKKRNKNYHTDIDPDKLQDMKLKKICIVYGNCHVGGVIEVLNNIPQFTEKYYIYPTKFIQNMKSANDLPDSILKLCDVFIHQAIRYDNRYGKEYASECIIKRLNPNSKIIAIPNVYGLPICFFPQFSKESEFKTKFPIRGTLFFRDMLLEETVRQHNNLKKVIERYNDTNAYKSTELEISWQKFIDKIKMREQDWDIKLSEYLMENARKTPLFYDPNHPTPCLIKYISVELLRLLGIDVNEQEVMALKIRALDPYEMPICNSVSKHFGLDYDLDKRELRKTGKKIFIGHMSLKGYVYQYYCMVWKEHSMPINVRIKSFVIYCILGGVNSGLICLKMVVRKIYKSIRLIFCSNKLT